MWSTLAASRSSVASTPLSRPANSRSIAARSTRSVSLRFERNPRARGASCMPRRSRLGTRRARMGHSFRPVCPVESIRSASVSPEKENNGAHSFMFHYPSFLPSRVAAGHPTRNKAAKNRNIPNPCLRSRAIRNNPEKNRKNPKTMSRPASVAAYRAEGVWTAKRSRNDDWCRSRFTSPESGTARLVDILETRRREGMVRSHLLATSAFARAPQARRCKDVSFSETEHCMAVPLLSANVSRGADDRELLSQNVRTLSVNASRRGGLVVR